MPCRKKDDTKYSKTTASKVGDVISDTDPPPEAPIREQRLDETEVGQSVKSAYIHGNHPRGKHYFRNAGRPFTVASRVRSSQRRNRRT